VLILCNLGSCPMSLPYEASDSSSALRTSTWSSECLVRWLDAILVCVVNNGGKSGTTTWLSRTTGGISKVDLRSTGLDVTVGLTRDAWESS
jgi:hypothetical protein